MVVGAAMATMISGAAYAHHFTSDSAGAIKAVDLIAAWVGAGAPNGDFTYEAINGKKGHASFDQDVLPLFTGSNVWYVNAPPCTSCHFGNVESSYHEMDLTSYEGLMKGGDVLSQPPGVPLFGQSTIGGTEHRPEPGIRWL